MIKIEYIACIDKSALDSLCRAYTFKFDGLNQESCDIISLIFTSPLTEQERDDVDDFVNKLKIKERIKSEYKNHTINGILFFENKRADLRILYDEGAITLADANYIENKLAVVKQDVCSGDWLTGQYELANNVVVEGAFTQEIYDSIKNEIDNYILESYS
jgi:hypothetical protein|tara:strand:- start:2536 stop:3015 length:480 start_codon:yes stop_codon:yes gene_type:complete